MDLFQVLIQGGFMPAGQGSPGCGKEWERRKGANGGTFEVSQSERTYSKKVLAVTQLVTEREKRTPRCHGGSNGTAAAERTKRGKWG